MKFTKKVLKGKILRRYKRFFADIQLESGEIVTAHTPNTGTMKTCWEPHWDCLVTHQDDPKRKLKYTLEMTHNQKSWIGVNTLIANKITIEAIKKQKIKELQDYDYIKPEISIGESRIDIYLSSSKDNSECYVEVKNVTMIQEETNHAIFPDAVSERGVKHLEELIKIKESGLRAVIFYLVQREDITEFSPADEIHPEYGTILRIAYLKGVEVLAYRCSLNEDEIKIAEALPIKL